MLMSVVRVEVSDIRLNLFCLGTFRVFSLYILPSKGKSAWRWDSSSIRSEFLILGFGNIVLSLVAHIVIILGMFLNSYLNNYLVNFLLDVDVRWSACHLYILITVSAIYRQLVRASWI